jgi:hypothetical protein
MAIWEKIGTQSVTIVPAGTPVGGYQLIAQGTSFDDLNSKLTANGGRLNSGDKVRFTMELNGPYAPAFNLAGAELLFRDKMPPGLILDDVRGEGMTTVIIDAHATSPWFAAVGAWLVSEWYIIPLIAIGISLILGAAITSIGFAVAFARSPQTIPQTAMWIALGVGGLALIGVIAYGAKKKGYI